MFKIAVLASGGGTDFQSIIDAVESKYLNVKIEMLIASKDGIYALERAKKHGIKTYVVSRKEFGKQSSDKILELVKGKVDLIVLAGFLSILDGEILKEFENRIINIHPSLIPSFCGKGYYGEKVHQGVIDYGAKVTGATVHFVDEGADTGPIIIQKTVEVKQDDDAKKLAERVLEVEHEILTKSISMFCENKLTVNGRRVYIND